MGLLSKLDYLSENTLLPWVEKFNIDSQNCFKSVQPIIVKADL